MLISEIKNDIIEDTRMALTMQKSINETIPEEDSIVALGATAIGSAKHAPDESYH
jgi:hypothetical protein